MGILFGGFMDRMMLVTCTSGEYEDRVECQLFVCRSMEESDACINAIKNWCALHSVERISVEPGLVYHIGGKDRHELEKAFENAFGVSIRIDFGGKFEFDREWIKVFNNELGS